MAGAPSGTGSSSSHSTGWRMNGSVCGPPRPPCEPISSSNAATSPSSGSYWLSSSRSGAWTIASSRLRLMIVCGAEQRRRVLALDPVLVEDSGRPSARRRPRRAPSSGPSAARRPGCAASVATSSGWSSSSSSTVSRWSWPVNQTSPRLPEPTTAIVDSSAGGGISSSRRGRRRRRRRLARERGAGDGRADALAPGDLRQERVHEGRSLGLGLRLDERRPPAHQVADDLAEALRRSAA